MDCPDHCQHGAYQGIGTARPGLDGAPPSVGGWCRRRCSARGPPSGRGAGPGQRPQPLWGGPAHRGRAAPAGGGQSRPGAPGGVHQEEQGQARCHKERAQQRHPAHGAPRAREGQAARRGGDDVLGGIGAALRRSPSWACSPGSAGAVAQSWMTATLSATEGSAKSNSMLYAWVMAPTGEAPAGAVVVMVGDLGFVGGGTRSCPRARCRWGRPCRSG